MTSDVLFPKNRPHVVIPDMETKREAIGAIKQMRAAAHNLDKQDSAGIEDPMKLFKINGDRVSLVADWPTGLTERERDPTSKPGTLE